MAWIETVEPEHAQGPLRRLYDAALRRAGRVWNIVKLTSLRPDVTEAHLQLFERTMHRPSALSRAERELVAVVVSAANACRY